MFTLESHTGTIGVEHNEVRETTTDDSTINTIAEETRCTSTSLTEFDVVSRLLLVCENFTFCFDMIILVCRATF